MPNCKAVFQVIFTNIAPLTKRTDDRKGRRTTSNENLISTIEIVFSCWLVSPLSCYYTWQKYEAVKGLQDAVARIGMRKREGEK